MHAALLPNAQPGQCKIETYRVRGISAAQRLGKLEGATAVSLFARRKSQGAPDPVHVRIHGTYQPAGWYRRPPARIHGITTDHPAQKEVQPFTRAASLGNGQQIICVGCTDFSKGPYESFERRKHGGMVFAIIAAKQSLERTPLFRDNLHGPQQLDEFAFGDKPMPEARTCLFELPVRGLFQERSGFPQPGHNSSGAFQYLRYPAKRQRRRNHSRDFPVERVFIVIEKFEWIGMYEDAMVIAGIYRFEPRLDSGWQGSGFRVVVS